MPPADAFAGLRIYPGYLDRDGQADLLAAVRNMFASAPLVHAAHAEVGTAVYGADVELRATWMGVGPSAATAISRRTRKRAGPGRRSRRRLSEYGMSSANIRSRRKPA